MEIAEYDKEGIYQKTRGAAVLAWYIFVYKSTFQTWQYTKLNWTGYLCWGTQIYATTTTTTKGYYYYLSWGDKFMIQ